MVGNESMLENGLQDEQGLRVLNSEFACRVGKLLQLYRGSKIYSFVAGLIYIASIKSLLPTWIDGLNSQLQRELNSLKSSCRVRLKKCLRFPSYLGNFELYTFPCLLLLSHTHGNTSCLKHLQLNLCNLECPPDFKGFNTLVNVCSQNVKLNESSLESFFSSRVLEELVMRRCTLPATLKATGPNFGPCVKLKYLEVLECPGVRSMCVYAPNLTSFIYSGRMVFFMLCGVQRLKKLFINFEARIFRNSVALTVSVVDNLPQDIPHLESLFLPLTTEMRTLPAKISSYVNLKELELEAFSRASVYFLWIGSTIAALPLLSKLRLTLSPHSHTTREEVRTMRTSGSPHNQLKEVLISGFVPFFYQTELVIYLLKNCVALERMTIDPQWMIYNMNWELKSLNDYCEWRKENGKEEQLYELMHREVPGCAGIVTIV